jgi:hypothetical protein
MQGLSRYNGLTEAESIETRGGKGTAVMTHDLCAGASNGPSSIEHEKTELSRAVAEEPTRRSLKHPRSPAPLIMIGRRPS